MEPKPQDSNEYADQGTAAHELAARCLKNGQNACVYLGGIIDVRNEDGTLRRSFEVDNDMAGAVQVYLDSIRDRLVADAILLVEVRVGGKSDTSGTADAIIIYPKAKALSVHDYKHGRGVLVVAEENPQLRLYGLQALHDLEPIYGEFEEVTMHVHQPRRDHYDRETMLSSDLYAWGFMVMQHVDAIRRGDTTLTPGDWCRWCPKAATCKALTTDVLNTVSNDFPDLTDLTEFGLAKAMDKVEMVEEWAQSVRAAARAVLDSGQPLPGWMLAVGREGNRKWRDERAVVNVLGEDLAYDKKVISPAVAEKCLRDAPAEWSKLQEFIVRGPPSIKMVRQSDYETPVTNTYEEFPK
jgi:hypothetical protein